MRLAYAFGAGALAGTALGVLLGAALGRHDDRGLLPWWEAMYV